MQDILKKLTATYNSIAMVETCEGSFEFWPSGANFFGQFFDSIGIQHSKIA